MQKLTDMTKTGGLEVKRLLMGGFIGVVAICIVCLILSLFVFTGIIPLKYIVLYSALSGFIGGMLAAVILGARGKILFYVPIMLCLMLAIIFVLGLVVFGRPFSLSSNPFMVVSILFGLSLGSVLINAR